MHREKKMGSLTVSKQAHTHPFPSSDLTPKTHTDAHKLSIPVF